MTEQEESRQSRKRSGAGTALASLFGGMWLLVGAAVSLSRGKWPAFMPPQFDLIAVPISMISETWGAYAGAVIAGVIGLVLVGFGIFLGTRVETDDA